MSALEQIRQRPILIISILGIALLLFILTAVDRPGELFSDNSTVAKVDGHKIDYMEFQRRVEQVSEQRRNQGYTNDDNARIQSMVLDQMINEALLNGEIEKLGIVVTDQELSNALLGTTPHPWALQTVRQMGIPSPQDLYDYAYNGSSLGVDPSVSQQCQQAWQMLEQNARQVLAQEKFGNLFGGVFVANKLDAKAYWADNATTSTIAYARTDYSTLSDDEYKPSEADIEALYKEEKEMFRLPQNTWVIDYITVDIAPSNEDVKAAQSEVTAAIAQLKTQEGTLAVEGNSKFFVSNVTAPKDKLAPALKSSLDKILADTVCQLPKYGDDFTIAKLLGVKTQTDSVLIDMAFLAENAPTDSVLAMLNGGKAAKDLGENLIAQSRDSMWVALSDAQFADIKADIDSAVVGRYFATTSSDRALMKVRTRKAPVAVYDIAQITYEVNPSSATVADLNKKFEEYVAQNNTPAKFKANAEKANYTVMEDGVTPASLSVGQLPDSRNAAKWAISNKAGKVSGVMHNDNDTRLIAVAVKDVYKGGYIPMTDARIREYLENKVRNRMKGEALVAKYKGNSSSVTACAAAMKVSVDTTQVTFGQPMVRNFPFNESALNANVAVAAKGKVVGPIALNNSVVTFQVLNVEGPTREFDFTNDAMQFNRTQGADALANSLNAILLGNNKVDYRIQKFYSDRK